MAPTPAEGFWCVCRKYCKGVRRKLNTANTWRRHLREAAEDEVDAIRLARRSDQFRAFINSFSGTSTNSSHKRSSNPDSGGDDSAKRPRMSSEPSPNHQREDHLRTRIEEDGLGNQATDHDTTDAGDEGHFIGAGNDPNLADQQVVGQGGEHPPPPPPPPDDNHPSWLPNCLLNIDLDELANTAGMPKLQHSMSSVSVQAIRNASLDDGIGLTGEALERLRTPRKEPLRIDDPYMELASTIFIALENSSEGTYEKIRKAIEKCFPGSELLSFHQTKRLLTDLSGVTDTRMG